MPRLTRAEIVLIAPELRRVVLQGDTIDYSLFGARAQAMAMAASALFYGFISEETVDSQIVERLVAVFQNLDERVRARKITTLVALHNDLDDTRDMAAKFAAERERVHHYVETGEVSCFE